MAIRHVPESTKIYRHHGGRWSVEHRTKKGTEPGDWVKILNRVTTKELNIWFDGLKNTVRVKKLTKRGIREEEGLECPHCGKQPSFKQPDEQ